jgi:hypothetical protein
MDAGAILAGAGAGTHLERERARARLEVSIDAGEAGPAAVAALEGGLPALFAAPAWERRLGGVRAARALVARGAASDAFAAGPAMDAVLALLEDPEVRVRWAVGELLRALCARDGVAAWDAAEARVLASIADNFDRDAAEPSSHLPARAGAASGAAVEDGDAGEGLDLVGALLRRTYAPPPPGRGEMRHATEGWKCLETSARALQHAMEGCGPAFRPRLDAALRARVRRCLSHPNRFVREAGHFALGSVATLLAGPALGAAAPELAADLQLGLGDNWSQVRFAAATAARAFLLALDEAQRGAALPLLVPHLCLNRYYVAEGVRLYSQETWALATRGEGREWVARCAPAVVDYYVEQSKANNHAVREAACACAAELACKVDRAAVAPHVPRLLAALVACFKDASWPVRDAACLALGRCAVAFPDECRPLLEELYALWFAHLWDNIYSVRDGAAVALGNAARAYGAEAIARVAAEAGALLPMAKEQPADSRARGGLENTTLFGVAAARAERANDEGLHSDQALFSCGSLAPKLARGGGCLDHGFARGREPWEASDGAARALRELAAVAPAAVEPFLPELAELAGLTHFAHCLSLQETLWQALPEIAERLGRAAFKPHLQAFVDPLFAGLECGHRLTEVAAGRAAARLRDLVGPGIFAGRLSDAQRAALAASADVPPPVGRGAAGPAVGGAPPPTARPIASGAP